NALGNLIGVVSYGAPGNIIGGSTAAARNVISGNTNQGIALIELSATNNIVQGNFIGTDVTGNLSLPNTYGVVLNSSGNLVGGIAAGQGNRISGNSGAGVAIGGT